MDCLSINEIKIIIRGLLVSSPEEVTVSKLRRDFKAQEGQDVPFFKFGFHDITSFLRSLPDVCRISHDAYGPYAVVTLVESDKSAHVNSLVMRQKTTTNKVRRRRPNFPTHGKSKQVNYKPISTYFEKQRYDDWHSKLIGNSIKYSSNVEETSTDSINVSKCYEHYVSNSIHHEEVKEQCSSACKESSEINTNKTYSSMSDVYGSEFSDIQSYIGFLLQEILVDDKGVHLSEIYECLQDTLSVYGIDSLEKVEQILNRIPNISIVDNYVYQHKVIGCQYKENIPNSGDCLKNGTTIGAGGLEDDSSSNCDKGSLSAVAEPFIPSGDGEKIQMLEHKLYSLMKDFRHGILGSDLKEKYKMKFAAPLNLQNFGYTTVLELVLHMPHIFSYINLKNGDFKLFPSWLYSGLQMNESKVASLELKKEPVIPDITKRNVQWLMDGYPNGLFLGEFEETYKDTFLGGIELKEMGFSSMEEFVKYLEKLNILKIKVSGSDMWLLPSLSPMNFAIDPLPSLGFITSEVDLNTLKEKFPPDVVGPDQHVAQVVIPSWIHKSSFIEIFVQEVNNPHNFWITFCGDQYTRALDSLMDDLQAFYCSKSHNYKMPIELIREGQDCVTQYVDEWHRARIISLISVTEVEVVFYDYGTRRVVQKDNIHFLHSAHSALPAQAIRAVLANIEPIEDRWTQEASKRFLQIIANKALIGIVKSVDTTNKVISLFLCDTSGEDDLYMHNILVSEGYAVETPVNYVEKGSLLDIKETNDHETIQLPEGENEPKFCVNERKEITSKSSNQDQTSLQTQEIQDIMSPNSSHKSSVASLPSSFIKDNMDCQFSVSVSTSLCGSAASTARSTSEITKTHDDHVGLTQTVSPPPGFSHASKSDSHLDIRDKKEKPVIDRQSLDDDDDNENDDEEPLTEFSKVSSDSVSNTTKQYKREANSEMVGHNKSVNGISSGVNANISQETGNTYLQNNFAYPNWPTPPTFSSYPGFLPPFPPVNMNTAITPLPLGSFPLPNPMDFCSMWYYEHLKQQAFLQGILAHQQMTASAFPPLPPGMYLPNNYRAFNTQPLPPNNMNISEVSSPESSVLKAKDLEKKSAECQAEIMSSATQTDMSSISENIDDMSKTKTISIGVMDYPTKKFTNINSSHDSIQTNNNSPLTPEKSNNSSSKGDVVCDKVPLPGNNVSDSDFIVTSNNTSFVAVNQIVKSSKGDVQINLTKNSSEYQRLNTSLKVPVLETFNEVNINNTQFDDSLDILKRVANQSTCDQVSVENFFPLVQPQESSDELENNYQCSKLKGSEQLCEGNVEYSKQNYMRQGSVFDSKLPENGMVLYTNSSFNTLHNLQNNTKIFNDSKQDLFTTSTKENREVGIEERELVQGTYSDLQYHNGFNDDDDDEHEHEMIKRVEQECVSKEVCRQKSKEMSESPETLLKLVANPDGVHCEERLQSSQKKKTDVLTTDCIQSTLPEMYSSESCEQQNGKSIEHQRSKIQEGKAEESVDHTWKFEQQYAPQQVTEENVEMLPLTTKNCKDYDLQKPSTSSESLLSAFHTLSISNESQHVNLPKSEIQIDSLISNKEDIDDVSCNITTSKNNLSKRQMRPVLGAKISNEVSASIISGPTQPAMTQEVHPVLPTDRPSSAKYNSSGGNTESATQSISWKTTWNLELCKPSVHKNSMSEDATRNEDVSSKIHKKSKTPPSNWHKESHGSAKPVINQQFVKTIILCDKIVHQLNFDGRPYVLTEEIVNYFTPFNGRHVILKILEARKVEINFLELSRRRRPEFFECLDRSDIQCISRGPTGNVIGSVHIVPLRSVPYMLRVLNKDNAKLSTDVNEEMEKFDPNDPYWSGFCG